MGLQESSSQLLNDILDKLSQNEDGALGWSLFFDFFNHYILWLFLKLLI